MSALWCVTIEIPLALKRLGNTRGHWGGKAQVLSDTRGVAHLAVKTQGRAFLEAARSILSGPNNAGLGVLMVREFTGRKREFDDDNLEHSLKGIRDGIGDALAAARVLPGLELTLKRVTKTKSRLLGADKHPRLFWERSHQQRTNRDAVRIHLEVVREAKNRDA